MKDVLVNQVFPKEQEELIGEYAERGFEPGSGPTQAALEELRKDQTARLEGLEQARAQEESRITSQIAELGLRMPEEIRGWVQTMATLAKPEIIGTAESGFWQVNPYTGESEQIIPPFQPRKTPQIITHETGIWQYDPNTGRLTQLAQFPPKTTEAQKKQDNAAQKGIEALGNFFAKTDFYLDPSDHTVKIRPGGTWKSWKKGRDSLNTALDMYKAALIAAGVPSATAIDQVNKLRFSFHANEQEVLEKLNDLLQGLDFFKIE
jgi:hypothetical protein